LPPDTTQAQAVTEVLARAVVSIGPYRSTRQIIRALPIGDRDYLSMKLNQLTFGRRAELVLTCDACGKKMDADFDLEAIPVAERPQQAEYVLRVEDEAEVRFRLASRRGSRDGHERSGAADPCLLDDTAERCPRRQSSARSRDRTGLPASGRQRRCDVP
jgi:hypothetical protein